MRARHLEIPDFEFPPPPIACRTLPDCAPIPNCGRRQAERPPRRRLSTCPTPFAQHRAAPGPTTVPNNRRFWRSACRRRPTGRSLGPRLRQDLPALLAPLATPKTQPPRPCVVRGNTFEKWPGPRGSSALPPRACSEAAEPSPRYLRPRPFPDGWPRARGGAMPPLSPPTFRTARDPRATHRLPPDRGACSPPQDAPRSPATAPAPGRRGPRRLPHPVSFACTGNSATRTRLANYLHLGQVVGDKLPGPLARGIPRRQSLSFRRDNSPGPRGSQRLAGAPLHRRCEAPPARLAAGARPHPVAQVDDRRCRQTPGGQPRLRAGLSAQPAG